MQLPTKVRTIWRAEGPLDVFLQKSVRLYKTLLNTPLRGFSESSIVYLFLIPLQHGITQLSLAAGQVRPVVQVDLAYLTPSGYKAS